VLLALPLTHAWASDGWAWRFPAISLSAQEISAGRQKRLASYEQACNVTPGGPKGSCASSAKIEVLVFGNSYEPDGYNFVSAMLARDPRVNITRFGTTLYCENLKVDASQASTDSEHCQVRFDALFSQDWLSRIDVVVYAASRPYEKRREPLLDILRLLKTRNPDLLIVTLGDYIVTRRPCAFLFNRAGTTDACSRPENVLLFADSPESNPLYEQFGEIESLYIDRVELLCRNRVLQNCLTRTENGTPAFYDRLHHSLEFSRMSGRLYAERNQAELQRLLELAGAQTAH